MLFFCHRFFSNNCCVRLVYLQLCRQISLRFLSIRDNFSRSPRTSQGFVKRVTAIVSGILSLGETLSLTKAVSVLLIYKFVVWMLLFIDAMCGADVLCCRVFDFVLGLGVFSYHIQLFESAYYPEMSFFHNSDILRSYGGWPSFCSCSVCSLVSIFVSNS